MEYHVRKLGCIWEQGRVYLTLRTQWLPFCHQGYFKLKHSKWKYNTPCFRVENICHKLHEANLIQWSIFQDRAVISFFMFIFHVHFIGNSFHLNIFMIILSLSILSILNSANYSFLHFKFTVIATISNKPVFTKTSYF